MDEMLSRSSFEDELAQYKIVPTEYAKDGVRLWRKPDGELFAIPIYDEYPSYMIEKILMEIGLYYLPLYTSNV
jgi:hypothetical protein